ncbi:flavoprotein [Streptomyces huiliensis]|uniref:flavoprotein n=1 Tax=Streptomyces huiliensis TaxID=2876027 RepID=UPI001CC09CE4|nr:flavoprotein [Streptomyces huiliensis]
MIAEPYDEAYAELPTPDIRRLLVVVTGSAYAWSTPYWLEWLRMHCPELEVRVVMTRSAERFVTRQAVAARVGGAVAADVWPEDESTARHVEWAEWAEAVLVYPATLHFMARLALGLADSPALLAAQSTRAPVALAPALPPGALEGEAVRRHWAALAARPNVVLVPPVPGRSLTTGREDAWVPPPLPEALRLLVEHLDRTAPALPADAAEPGTEFGTGLLRTSVHPLPSGGARWRRTPGPLAPAPFAPTDAEPYGLLRGVGDLGGVRPALGVPHGPARLYDVGAEVSAAHVLLHEGPVADLEKPLHGLGRLLNAVHGLRPPAGAPAGPPRGWRRLGDWLAGRAVSPRAACAQAQLRRGLGEERWAKALAWYERTVTDPDVTLAHGSPGLGSLVVDRATGGTDLLTGEDLGTAPWYVDLGWVVGELVELQWQVGGDKGAWQSLTDALFEGYGRDLGPEWNAVPVLRILLHVHDIAAYLDDFEHGFTHYRDFLRFLIDLQ